MKDFIIDFTRKNTLFLINVIIWLVLAFMLPVILINNKYHVFVKHDDVLKFTGWTLIICIIIFVGVYTLCSYIIKAYSVKYRYWVQLLKGFQTVILPLIILYLVCDVISTNVVNIKQIIWGCILSEAGAIIINPFPRFVYKHKNADIRAVYGLGGKD